jgi:hypothetical protein
MSPIRSESGSHRITAVHKATDGANTGPKHEAMGAVARMGAT